MVVEIFMYLPELIAKETGREVDFGSYSGHAAPDEDPFAVMDLLERAVGKLGYKKNICYALDCAATGYYDVQEKAYRYRVILLRSWKTCLRKTILKDLQPQENN